MKTRAFLFTCSFTLWAAVASASTQTQPAQSAPSDDVFHVVTKDYEAIRRSLIADGTAGAPERSKAILEALRGLQDDFTAVRAGVSEDDADAARALLKELVPAAEKLAAARGLEPTRDAFYALSKPMVRYRELVHGERPMVVYCPMVKRSWLQPDEPIGNPYHGTSMLRCGTVVSR